MPASPRTLPAVLRTAATTYADRPAYVEGGSSLTYADLLARVRETARGYVGLGLEPGDKVVVWAPNSIDWAVAGLAVSYAGGVLVPANSRYTGHEVADLVRRTDARLVVVADGFLGRTQVADLLSLPDLDSLAAVIRIRKTGSPMQTDPDSAAEGVRSLGLSGLSSSPISQSSARRSVPTTWRHERTRCRRRTWRTSCSPRVRRAGRRER